MPRRSRSSHSSSSPRHAPPLKPRPSPSSPPNTSNHQPFSSSHTPPPSQRVAPPPSPAMQPPPTTGSSGGLGSTLAQGFAFGTGSSLARHAVGSMLGGGGDPIERSRDRVSRDERDSREGDRGMERRPGIRGSFLTDCEPDHHAFVRCVQSMVKESEDVSRCDTYFDALKACQAANPRQPSEGYQSL